MLLLETSNLGLQRGNGTILHFPDLRLLRGEKALLLGASGTGKTTLLSMLAGFLRPTSGQINFNGDDFYALPAAKRDALRGRHFGFVFQTLHLLPSLTLRQNIALAARMAGRQAEDGRLEHLIDTLGLSEKADRKPDALSHGEAQRAALARAVLLKPDLLIADEPTSALDDANAQSVIDLLEEQAASCGATLLIATHDQRIINRFSTVIHLTPATMGAQNQRSEAA
ncbi:MAG: ABC transporter ATP-binding protein [Pseudobdellovibrionaceae bacterium]